MLKKLLLVVTMIMIAFASKTDASAAGSVLSADATLEQISADASIIVASEGDFSINAQGYIIAYNGDKLNVTEIAIPRTISGTTVTGIDEGALSNCPNLKSIYVPDSVTFFGSQAFARDYSLNSIVPYSGDSPNETASGKVILPKNIQTISADAFLKCKGISTFAIDPSNPYFTVTTLDSNTMLAAEDVEEGSGLLTGFMIMSKDKTTLVRSAPAYDQHGKGIETIPSSVVNVGPYSMEALHICGQSFTFPAATVNVGAYAFYGCNNLGVLNFPEGCSLTTIGDFAFTHNDNLRASLPATLTKMGEYCFAQCNNIMIDFANTAITEVPAYCFFESVNLRCLSDVASAEASGVALPAEGALLVFPKELQSIEAYAFKECNNLNTIFFLGNKLKKLGTGAFQGCQNLHLIDIPYGVVEIENYTFDGCQNLNTIILPDTVEIIGDCAFRDNRNIHEFVIPEGVSHISNSSFEGANTDEIDTSKNEYSQQYIKGALPENGTVFEIGGVKYKVLNNEKLTLAVTGLVNKKAKTATVTATVWKNGYGFKVTQIAKNAFKNCKKLKKLNLLTKSLKKVGKNSFKGVKKNIKIKVPKKNLKKYKKLLKKKATGLKKSAKITK